jgi:hypothetical protein
MKTIVSAHRSMPTVLPAQFGSVFTCNLMLILYTSLADRPKLKIPVACVPRRKVPSSGIHSFMTTGYFVQFQFN